MDTALPTLVAFKKFLDYMNGKPLVAFVMRYMCKCYDYICLPFPYSSFNLLLIAGEDRIMNFSQLYLIWLNE